MRITILSVSILLLIYNEPTQAMSRKPKEKKTRGRTSTLSNQPNNYYSSRLDALTTEDRRILAQKHLDRLCTTKHGETQSCGYRDEWANEGDPNFTWDNYMNKIPRNTKFDIEVKCDKDSGLFYTNISTFHCTSNDTGGKNCRKVYFSNPYKTNRLWSTTPQNWLTSPGIYNDTKTMRTDLPEKIVHGKSGIKLVAQENHIVSSAKIYEGTRMPNVIWLKGGYAFHGSNNVDGRPWSQGCLRLSQYDAFALYQLARRVGPRRFNITWGGYGEPTPPDGRPRCAGTEAFNQRRVQEFYASIENGENNVARNNLGQAADQLAQNEGKVPTGTDTDSHSEEESTSTNSIQ